MSDSIKAYQAPVGTLKADSLTLSLIARYDLSGPRYTSYPTAPQFHDQFSERDLGEAVARSNSSGRDLSLYFHIPFCDTVCYYCACNKIVTGTKKRVIPYLSRLHEEVALRAKSFDRNRLVTQLHWGGGTPTFISDEQMTDLMACTSEHFSLLKDDSGEYSIEVHPGLVSVKTITHLRRLGFNRLSIGVQDFNEATQKAVNRFNSFEEVKSIVSQARQDGFHSISMDLIYGLPFQTVESLSETLRQVLLLSPERISLFNYAHMPELFKVQKQIDESTLPSPQQKIDMLGHAIEVFIGAGYVYIGMDHFARPDDELAIAQKNGELQRGFQGYSTKGETDLVGFGVSSISFIDNVYSQNYKVLDQYNEAIDTQRQPIARGYTLLHDDLVRRRVIHQLICHLEVDFRDIEDRFGIDFLSYFSQELIRLEAMVEDGLVSLKRDRILVEVAGRLLVRRVCMVFDAYINVSAQSYSRII